MLLRESALDTRMINALAAKGIFTVEDLVRTFPRRYHDYRTIHTVQGSVGQDCAVAGVVGKVKKSSTSRKASMVSVTLTDAEGTRFHARWFGRADLQKRFGAWIGKEVVVCGEVQSHPQFGYSIMESANFAVREAFPLRIVTEYPGIKGVSEERLRAAIKTFLDAGFEDPVPQEYVARYGLLPYIDAVRSLHFPKTMEEMEAAQKRILFNDLLYYAVQLDRMGRQKAVGTPFSPMKVSMTMDYIKSLPYEMTPDQRSAFEGILKELREGRRIQALLQGDVGYGKSLVAFLCMLLMAESGFQSALMAPTTVLARQHYKDLKEIGDKYGIKTAFLGGDITAKERKEYLRGIESGEYLFIVGTTGLIQKKVVYKDLGFVITDEEQKFGVVQREELTAKASRGVNVLTMSATPVPRTLAMALYGTKTEVLELHTRPAGRQATQTAINRNERAIMEHIRKQVEDGRQVYVVCPFITKAEDKRGSDNVITVEDTYKRYCDYFADMPGAVDMATGKMKAEELQEHFAAFKDGKTKVLVSTTIVEVGVNVPNASTIVIYSAERFGLSCLHQLRGRVGRGQYKGYCILRISDMEPEGYAKAKERLQILADSTDGFEIAKADLSQRKPGDFIGSEQTGKNKYVELMMEHEKLFLAIRNIAAEMIDKGQEEALIRLVEEECETTISAF